MDTQNNNINLFALTDCHQEARKLCQLFSGIIRRAPKNGKNTLICDCGDLFKGIYDRNLCVDSYLQLRQQLPEAKIVLALGNNDFGFNAESFDFLKQTAKRFNQANIHLLCANLRDIDTDTYPQWVDPYILLDINQKKFLVTAFCVNYIRLQKYGLYLEKISDAFLRLKETIKYIQPDACIILNHALMPSSLELRHLADENEIPLDLILGGHEHESLAPDTYNHIYYPAAFSRTALHFDMQFYSDKRCRIDLTETIYCKQEDVLPPFIPALDAYEEEVGLNLPIAPSTLNLERRYADPCAIGTFIADLMKNAAKADVGLISTGYIIHALRYEHGKILTHYNVERAFSAKTPLQTVTVHPVDLKNIFDNALRNRYILLSGNTRFLQASQNITVDCMCREDKQCVVRQIYLNNEPLLGDDGKSLHPEDSITCAIDPFIGSGELGFETFKAYPKETLMKNNRLVYIKDLFFKAVKDAPKKYAEGTSYPAYKIIDENI